MERSRDWLAQAERDLGLSALALKEGYYEWACFSAQQAAEKAVKAFFQSLHREAIGHSISELLRSLPKGFQPPPELIEKAIILDRFYIPTCYPNALERGAPKDYYLQRDGKEAHAYAGEIIKYCKDLLGER